MTNDLILGTHAVWHIKTRYAPRTESRFNTNTIWYAQYWMVCTSMMNL